MWLCVLPLRLRRHGMMALLRGGPRGDATHGSTRAGLSNVVQTVLRVCRLRVFSNGWFPRPCLRESLTLYHVLQRMGYPAEFHIGVRKQGHALAAHSWVTLRGARIIRDNAEADFRELYSYPPPDRSNQESMTHERP